MTSPPKRKRPDDDSGEEAQKAEVQKPEAEEAPPQPTKKPMASAWSSVFAQGARNALAAASAAQVADVLLVLDLEATCSEERRAINPQETIEIGVVAVELKHPRGGSNNNGAAAAAAPTTTTTTTHNPNNPPPPLPRLPRLLGPSFTFHSYAKPTAHPQLTDFCVGLTGVKQEQVDGAPPIAEVLASFERWLDVAGLLPRRLLAVTWTTFDLGLCLGRELVWRRVPCPAALRSFADLKKLYGQNMKKLFGVGGMAPRLKEALGQAGLAWEGREHSALDDARNTARLAMVLVERGVKIEPTGVAAGCANGGGGGGGGAASGGAAAAAPKPPAQRQLTLAPKKPPPPAFDAKTRRWLGRCNCGVDAQKRQVRRPGPTNGKSFFSCGRWTMASGKGECDFFLWEAEVPSGSTLPPERSRFGGKKKSGGGGGGR